MPNIRYMTEAERKAQGFEDQYTADKDYNRDGFFRHIPEDLLFPKSIFMLAVQRECGKGCQHSDWFCKCKNDSCNNQSTSL